MKYENVRSWHLVLRAGLAMVAALAALTSHAQNAIEAVSGSMQGGSEVIRIDLKEPLAAVPTGFTIQVPARIALDFPGVSNAIGRSSVDISQGNLRTVNVIRGRGPNPRRAESQAGRCLQNPDSG